MKNYIKTYFIPLLVLSSFPSLTLAAEDAGFYIGGGAFGGANTTCVSYDYDYSYDFDCSYGGYDFEAGYDFNSIIGIEGKYGIGENSSRTEIDLTFSYFGLNIGHDFGTGWFRLYGKIGAVATETSVDDVFDNYESSDSSVTFGIGSRFTFGGSAKGFYAKIETVVIPVDDGSSEVIFLGGVGYRF